MRTGMAIAAMLVLFIAVFGCAMTQEVSPDAIRNLTFKSSWTGSGKAQLRDGEYREPRTPGSATQLVVKLTDMAFGSVGGSEVGAAILVSDPGGSGTFYDLALLVKRNGNWENTHVAPLGDRVRIRSLSIQNGAIVVEMTVHGPQDAMCCPTRPVMRHFAVVGDRLVREVEHAGEKRPTEITDILWTWKQSIYGNDTEATPPKPENYTVLLRQDGALEIRADCNRCGGTYRVDDGRLSMKVTYCTRAMCPPGSLDQVFIRDLNAAVIYFFKDGDLFIDLKYDTGTMRFSK